MEGAVVNNVVKSEAFKNNKEPDEDEGVTNNEDEVLLSLFKTSGKKTNKKISLICNFVSSVLFIYLSWCT